MNKYIIGCISVLAGIGLFLLPLDISAAVVGCLLTGLVVLWSINTILLKKVEQERTQRLIERIDERIWDIPVELTCRHCSYDETIDFSLETRGFRCSQCKGWNRLFIQFTAVGETERSLGKDERQNQ